MPPTTRHPPIGLFGSATIQVGESRDAVVVSPNALRNAWSGGTEVVVCNAGQAQVRAVEVGLRDPNQVEIVRGLSVDERIVSDNVVGLTDGQPLRETP